MSKDQKILNQLLLAKKMSDKEDYVSKYNIMQKLLKERPEEFYIDQDNPDYPGIVHAPTGFRMHLPKQATYGVEKKAFIKEAVGNRAARRVMEIVANDPDAYDRIKNKPEWMRPHSFNSATHTFLPRYMTSLDRIDDNTFLPTWMQDDWHSVPMSDRRLQNFENMLSRQRKKPYNKPRLPYESVKKIEGILRQAGDSGRNIFLRDIFSPTEETVNNLRTGNATEIFEHIKPRTLKFRPRIHVDDIPNDPSRYGFRGLLSKGSVSSADNLFFSGHAPIASVYAEESGRLQRVKPHHIKGPWPVDYDKVSDPLKENFWTSHVRLTDPSDRYTGQKEKIELPEEKRPKFVAFSEAINPYELWGSNKNYEAVANFEKQPRSFPVRDGFVGVHLRDRNSLKNAEIAAREAAYLLQPRSRNIGIGWTDALEEMIADKTGTARLDKQKFVEFVKGIPKTEFLKSQLPRVRLFSKILRKGK